MSGHIIEQGYLVTHKLWVKNCYLILEEYCSNLDEVSKIKGKVERVNEAKIMIGDNVTADVTRTVGVLRKKEAYKKEIQNIIDSIRKLEVELKSKVRWIEDHP